MINNGAPITGILSFPLSSVNNAIEIYNGTGADVALGSYNLWQINNGGIWFEKELELPDSILEAGDVFVVCRASADEAILIVCDDTTNSSVMNFNGDDAVGGGFNQVGLEALYRFGAAEQWYLGGRYNNVSGERSDAAVVNLVFIKEISLFRVLVLISEKSQTASTQPPNLNRQDTPSGGR